MVGSHRSKYQNGFTVVEVAITIVVAALFIIAISQLQITQSKVSAQLKSKSRADLLAYNNLRTYAYGKSPSWFNCEYSGGVPLVQTLINKNEPVEGIASPVIQTVTASAPYGCGGGSSGIGYPIKVVSKVTYGSPSKEVVHATYSTY